MPLHVQNVVSMPYEKLKVFFWSCSSTERWMTRSTNTKKKWSNEAMKRWCHENYEDTSTIFDNWNEFLLPVQADVVLNFVDNNKVLLFWDKRLFEWSNHAKQKIKVFKKAVKAQKAEYSFSQVRGFKSAWLGITQGFSEECDKILEE